jgi:hypothetical protein
MRTDIKTLIVRGGEYAKSQALKLESVKDDVGLEDMTVTYIPDPGAYEGCAPTLMPRVRAMTKGGSDEDSEEDSEGIRIRTTGTMTKVNEGRVFTNPDSDDLHSG